MIYAKKHELPKAKDSLPSSIRKKAESQSGISLYDVKVDYQSTEPKHFGAHALTYGNNIYIGPGKGNYLQHEIGHAIQQKVMQVPRTGIERGLPVNNNRIVEQKAIPSNYVGRQEIKHVLPVIQKASTSVTLFPAPNGLMFHSSDVIIDTINLPKRFKTSLKSGNQGDHTIADVLIKRSQKHYVMGKNLLSGLEYYAKNLIELSVITENYEGEANDEERKIATLSQCNNTVNVINDSIHAEYPLQIWNIILKQVIQSYNEAYANSIFSTTEGNSGGRGEGTAMMQLKKGYSDESTLYRLLDLSSVNRITGTLNNYQENEEDKNIRQGYIELFKNRIDSLYEEDAFPDLSIKDLEDKLDKIINDKSKQSKILDLKNAIKIKNTIAKDTPSIFEYIKILSEENPITTYLVNKTLSLINDEKIGHVMDGYLVQRSNLKTNINNRRHIYELSSAIRKDISVINKVKCSLITILDITANTRELTNDFLEKESQNSISEVAELFENMKDEGFEYYFLSNLLKDCLNQIDNCINSHEFYINKYAETKVHEEVVNICKSADNILHGYYNYIDGMDLKNLDNFNSCILNINELEQLVMSLNA